MARSRPKARRSPQAPPPGITWLETHRNRFTWTKRLEKLLGRVPDRVVAQRAGLSMAPVVNERRRRGIPSFRPTGKRIEWTPQMIRLLGSASDRAVAAELGINHHSVFVERRRRGIRAFGERPHPGPEGFPWTKKTLGLLGTLSDRSLASKLGISASAVFIKRRELGIPGHHKAPRPIRWTKRMLATLGKEPDIAIARRFAIGKDTVAWKRHELGIAPPRGKPRRVAHTPELPEVLKLPNPVLRERYGLSKEAATKLRKELGLPTPDSRNRRWPPEVVARLGKEPDAAIARDLGLVPTAVGFKRRSLGIRPLNVKHLWTGEESALLGRLPDEDVAAKVGVSLAAAKQRRQAVGIPKPPPAP